MPVLFAFSITLRISYSWSGRKLELKLSVSICLLLTSILLTLNEPSLIWVFLLRISNSSPTLIDDSFKTAFDVNGPIPSTLNLELVLYFQELAKISL